MSAPAKALTRRYRRKIVEVDAVQITEDMVVAHLCEEGPLPEGVSTASASYHPPRGQVHRWVGVLTTLDGEKAERVEIGDWIVTDWQGLPHVYTADQFRADFEPVPGSQP